MKTLTWLLAISIVGGLGFWLWYALKRVGERRAAAEERAASFLAQAMGGSTAAAAAIAPKPSTPGVQEQLLHDAAFKAAAAGEPALSIQLYARLLSRFPQSSLATQARAAVEVQKKKLGTLTSPGTAAPG